MTRHGSRGAKATAGRIARAAARMTAAASGLAAVALLAQTLVWVLALVALRQSGPGTARALLDYLPLLVGIALASWVAWTGKGPRPLS